jgi:hypothetical protein
MANYYGTDKLIYTTTIGTGNDDVFKNFVRHFVADSIDDFANRNRCYINSETFEKIEQDHKRQKVKDFNNSIRKVIFNDPAVVIIWKDGTKTTVKCQKGDKFDKEKGLAIAIVKHMFGDMGYYNTIFDKWLNEEN